MVMVTDEMLNQFETLMEKVDDSLKRTFQNVHNGYEQESLVRFLKARDGNVLNAFKMLTDCLKWRIQNEIDNILMKPIYPVEFYTSIRDSQLNGMSGYTKEGIPVFAVGVGRSTFDKASTDRYVQSHIQINEYRDRVILPFMSKKFDRYIGTCIKVLDMTGLKISALSQLKILTAISTIDDLNYPEKTDTYYIVNAPYIFSACWKVVRPLLQERTRKKVQVLSGSGRDELLKIMDYEHLPHFCRRDGHGSGSGLGSGSDCFSLDHPFHQDLYNYMKDQGSAAAPPARQNSIHVEFPDPDPEDVRIVQTIELELQKLRTQNGLKINGN